MNLLCTNCLYVLKAAWEADDNLGHLPLRSNSNLLERERLACDSDADTVLRLILFRFDIIARRFLCVLTMRWYVSCLSECSERSRVVIFVISAS
jgi:hypothetical protein